MKTLYIQKNEEGELFFIFGNSSICLRTGENETVLSEPLKAKRPSGNEKITINNFEVRHIHFEGKQRIRTIDSVQLYYPNLLPISHEELIFIHKAIKREKKIRELATIIVGINDIIRDADYLEYN